MAVSQTAQNIPVDRIDSPYSITIEENRSTLKGTQIWQEKFISFFVLDGVYVRLRTRVRCQLRAYWFVHIQGFYAELDATDFRWSLSEDRFLLNRSTHRESFE